MKIAYFTTNRTTIPSSASEIAASASVTYELVQGLADKHDITLYAPKGSQVDNVEVVTLDLPPYSVDASLADNDWTIKASLGMKQLYIGELFKHADKYDIIHLQTEPVYLAMPYVSLIKTPVLFTTHNTFHEEEKAIFHYFDNKINFSALSHAQAKLYGLTQTVPIIYNGIDTKKYRFHDSAEDYVLFLGRLHADKGIEQFLELSSNMPQQKFTIVGKGSTTLTERVKSSSENQSNTSYLGMLPHESVEWFSTIQNAKAVIMPIQYEDSCPLVPLEAMACGTPVIAYARGALPEEIVDGKTGFLINQSENYIRRDWIIKKTGIEGLCEAIERINVMPEEEYKEMRKNCREHVEKHFTVERMVDEYEQVYQQIINLSH